MNIKLHTPKSLKMGSGIATMKQFLLSIVATSISIALTFGTAAVIDNNKKQKAKREIVMMVMYDMYNTLQSVEKADTMLNQMMDIQLQIAKDTTKFDNMRFQMMVRIPRLEYTETTERIFSTNIETINTVGNVLFIENVANFYQDRKNYKVQVCDSISNIIIKNNNTLTTLDDLLGFDYYWEVILSNYLVKDMQHLFAECKQMMDVTDEEMVTYRKEREKLEKNISDKKKSSESIENKVLEMQKKIENAKKKLKLDEK